MILSFHLFTASTFSPVEKKELLPINFFPDRWNGRGRREKKWLREKIGRKCQKIIVFNKECEWHANNVGLLNESAKLFNDDWDQWKTNNLILYFFLPNFLFFKVQRPILSTPFYLPYLKKKIIRMPRILPYFLNPINNLSLHFFVF